MGMNQSGAQLRSNIWSAQYAADDVIGSSIWREAFNALPVFILLLLKNVPRRRIAVVICLLLLTTYLYMYLIMLTLHVFLCMDMWVVYISVFIALFCLFSCFLRILKTLRITFIHLKQA